MLLVKTIAARCRAYHDIALNGDRLKNCGERLEAARHYAAARDGFEAAAADIVGLLAALERRGYRPAVKPDLVKIARHAGRAADWLENMVKALEAEKAE